MNFRKILATFLCVVSLCLCSASVYAETKSLPKIISSALEKYQKEGADQLIPNLLIGSPIEGDKTALSQVNLIRQIEAFYGKFISADLFKATDITKTTTLIYFVMNYEKGPLYSSATIFKANGKEIVSTFNFHTDIKQIIPSELIFK
jgi:hypothetical protein